jgi:hypothetical protein
MNKEIELKNMSRMKIELVTQNDVLEFMNIASQAEGEVYVEDGTGHLRISAKSILGVKMASVEWNDLYAVYSDPSVSTKLFKFAR